MEAAIDRTATTGAERRADVPTAELRALVKNVERVLQGKHEVVEIAIVAIASGGNLLVEDVPGVGKTVLARALARSIDATFARVQGAPDLLPSDVTGTAVYDQGRHEFRFVPGPLFAHIVLVDELNRTTPRTQAALLEAMEEHQVTVDGVTHPLPSPHLILATQNPVEHHGTYPLPESQLDRFALATSIGYPREEDESLIVQSQVRRHPLETLGPVIDVDGMASVRERVREVTVSDELVSYVVRLVSASRDHEDIALGASPRASVQLVHAAQALAALRGRDHVLPDDVKELAKSVLGHRLLLRGPGDAGQIVSDLLTHVPVQTSR